MLNSAVSLSIGERQDSTEYIQDLGPFLDARIRTDNARRHQLFLAFESFLNAETSGIFLVEGSPGTGKSTFLAQLRQERNVLLHVAAPGDHLAGTLNILGQLVTSHEGSDTRMTAVATWREDVASALLRNRLQRSAEQTDAPIVVAIDGPPDPGELNRNRFYGFTDPLPKGVFLVIASRPGLYIPYTCPRFTVNLDRDDTYWRKELEAFVYRNADRLDNRLDIDADSVLASAGGSWLLASLLLSDASAMDDDNALNSGSRPGLFAYLARQVGELALHEQGRRCLELFGLVCWNAGPLLLRTVELGLNMTQASVEHLLLSCPTSNLDIAPIIGGEEALQLRHEVMAEVAFDRSDSLLASERLAMRHVRAGGRRLLGQLYGPTLAPTAQGAPSLEAFLAEWLTQITSGFVHARSAALLDVLGGNEPWTEIGGSALRSTMEGIHPSGYRRFLAAAWGRVLQVWRRDTPSGLDAIAAGATLTTYYTSLGGQLLSLEPEALAALFRRGVLEEAELRSILDALTPEHSAAVVTAAVRSTPPDEIVGLGPGWTQVLGTAVAPRRTSSQVGSSVLSYALEAFRYGSFDSKLKAIDVLSTVEDVPSADWLDLAIREVEPYVALRLVALGLRASDIDHQQARRLAVRRIIELRGVTRVRCLVELSLADPGHATWRSLIADELASARLSPNALKASRTLLEVARGAPPSLNVALSDEAISRATQSIDRRWIAFVAAALPTASAAGIRAGLSFALERSTASEVAELCRAVATSDDAAALSEALSTASRLPDGVRGVATIPLRSRLIEKEFEIPLEESLGDFEQLPPHSQVRVLRFVAGMLPMQDLDLSANRSRRYIDKVAYVAAAASHLSTQDFERYLVHPLRSELSAPYSARLRASVLSSAPVPILVELLGQLEQNADSAGVSGALLRLASCIPRPSQLVIDLTRRAIGVVSDDSLVLACNGMRTCGSWLFEAMLDRVAVVENLETRLELFGTLTELSPAHHATVSPLAEQCIIELFAGSGPPTAELLRWSSARLLMAFESQAAESLEVQLAHALMRSQIQPHNDEGRIEQHLKHVINQAVFVGSTAADPSSIPSDKNIIAVAARTIDHALWTNIWNELAALEPESEWQAITRVLLMGMLWGRVARETSVEWLQTLLQVPETEDEASSVIQTLADACAEGRIATSPAVYERIIDLARISSTGAELIAMLSEQETDPICSGILASRAIELSTSCSYSELQKAASILWRSAPSLLVERLEDALDHDNPDYAYVVGAAHGCGGAGARGKEWARSVSQRLPAAGDRLKVLAAGLVPDPDIDVEYWSDFYEAARVSSRVDLAWTVAGLAPQLTDSGGWVASLGSALAVFP